MHSHEVFRGIAFRAMTEKGFWEQAQLMGVRLEEWPPTRGRFLLEKFLKDLEDRGFDFAFWNLTTGPNWSEIENLNWALPETEEGLKALYEETIEIVRGQELGAAILQAPHKAYELLKNFENRQQNSSRVIDMAASMQEYHDAYTAKVAAGESVVGIPLWSKLADAIGGFNPERIAICKAESGLGKSMLAMNLAFCAAQKQPVLYVNMEMSLMDMYERLWAMTSEQGFSKIRRDGPPSMDLVDALKPEHLFMTDGRDMSFIEIRAMARKIKEKHGLLMFIIDYDQKLVLDVPAGGAEWREMQRVMARFEQLAKELQCFGLILAQTNLDGHISSTHRARFSASTIWHFRKDDLYSYVIDFDKNRFCERGTAITVQYEGWCGRIKEGELVKIVPATKASKFSR